MRRAAHDARGAAHASARGRARAGEGRDRDGEGSRVRRRGPARWRTVGRVVARGLAIGAGTIGVAYLLAFGATFIPAAERVPASVWRSGDPALLHTALRAAPTEGQPGAAAAGEGSDPIAQALEAATRASGGTVTDPRLEASLRQGAAPPRVIDAARRWTGALNAVSHGSGFVYAQVDSTATLFVVPGPWWGKLPREQQALWVDQYGARWRHYLRSRFGPWDASEGFAPGLVVMDTLGFAAASIDGSVRVRP